MKRFAGLLALTIVFTACQARPETSLPSSASQLQTPTVQVENMVNIDFEGINIPITFSQEYDIDDITMPAGMLCFTYKVGGLQGNAELYPGYLNAVDAMEDLRSASFDFDFENGMARLAANWKVKARSGQDTFLLQEENNLWVRCREGIQLYPMLLTREETERLYPHEELTEQSFVTLTCFEPLFDVWVYQVPDLIGERETELLAHYDEYHPGDSFLWQSDSSRPVHLTVMYTNSQSEQIIYIFGIGGGKNIDGTGMMIIDEPDW